MAQHPRRPLGEHGFEYQPTRTGKPKITENSPPIFNIDEGDNADWLRRTWTPEMPQNLPDLRKFLHDIGMTVEEFKASVLYRNVIDKEPWLKDV